MYRWLGSEEKIHFVPTILVTEIQEWPEVIELTKNSLTKGECDPQLHGFEHIDYNKLKLREIIEHLEKSLEWFTSVLKYQPTVWCTPWGATSEKMETAAHGLGLELETTYNTLTPGKAIGLSSSFGVKVLENKTVMDHWWKRGLNVSRLVKIIGCGSFEQAAEENPELFPDA